MALVERPLSCPQQRKTAEITTAHLVHFYTTRWSVTERALFFYKLLASLDESHQHYTSNLLAQRLYCDFIARLPRLLAVRILRYLNIQQIASASLVSKKWYERCKDGTLWKQKYFECHTDLPARLSETDDVNWKKMFARGRSVRANWNSGKCKVINCQGHTGRVLSVTLNGTHLATGSLDRTIKLWDLASNECVETLKGHVKGIWALIFYTDNLLISGSYDTSIKIWNLRKGRCIRTILGHHGPVWAMSRRGNVVVSVSQDKTAKVWDISRCLPLHSLEGHKEAVFALDMDDKLKVVFTGSADKTVRIWSYITGQLQRTLPVSSTTSIMSVVYSNGHLACCYGNTICVYMVTMNADVIGGIDEVRLLRQYQEHQDRIENLQLKVLTIDDELQTTLISAGRDAVIKYWDLATDASVHTFTGHQKQINCVCFDTTRMASASYDNNVKIWDFFHSFRQ